MTVSIETLLQALFKNGAHDGLYIHNLPLVCEALAQCSSVFLERIPNTELVRAWTIAEWEKQKAYVPPVSKSSLVKAMNAAMDEDNFELFCKLRKQIKEMETKK